MQNNGGFPYYQPPVPVAPSPPVLNPYATPLPFQPGYPQFRFPTPPVSQDTFQTSNAATQPKPTPWYMTVAKEAGKIALIIGASTVGGMVTLNPLGAITGGAIASGAISALEQYNSPKKKIDLGLTALDTVLGAIPGGAGGTLFRAGEAILKKMGVNTAATFLRSTSSLVPMLRAGTTAGIDGGLFGLVGGATHSAYEEYEQSGKVNWQTALKNGFNSIIVSAATGGGLGVLISLISKGLVRPASESYLSQKNNTPQKPAPGGPGTPPVVPQPQQKPPVPPPPPPAPGGPGTHPVVPQPQQKPPVPPPPPPAPGGPGTHPVVPQPQQKPPDSHSSGQSRPDALPTPPAQSEQGTSSTNKTLESPQKTGDDGIPADKQAETQPVAETEKGSVPNIDVFSLSPTALVENIDALKTFLSAYTGDKQALAAKLVERPQGSGSPIIEACIRSKSSDPLERVLNACDSSDLPQLLMNSYLGGNTLLHIAVRDNRLDLVEILLKKCPEDHVEKFVHKENVIYGKTAWDYAQNKEEKIKARLLQAVPSLGQAGAGRASTSQPSGGLESAAGLSKAPQQTEMQTEKPVDATKVSDSKESPSLKVQGENFATQPETHEHPLGQPGGESSSAGGDKGSIASHEPTVSTSGHGGFFQGVKSKLSGQGKGKDEGTGRSTDSSTAKTEHKNTQKTTPSSTTLWESLGYADEAQYQAAKQHETIFKQGMPPNTPMTRENVLKWLENRHNLTKALGAELSETIPQLYRILGGTKIDFHKNKGRGVGTSRAVTRPNQATVSASASTSRPVAGPAQASKKNTQKTTSSSTPLWESLGYADEAQYQAAKQHETIFKRGMPANTPMTPENVLKWLETTLIKSKKIHDAEPRTRNHQWKPTTSYWSLFTLLDGNPAIFESNGRPQTNVQAQATVSASASTSRPVARPAQAPVSASVSTSRPVAGPAQATASPSASTSRAVPEHEHWPGQAGDGISQPSGEMGSAASLSEAPQQTEKPVAETGAVSIEYKAYIHGELQEKLKAIKEWGSNSSNLSIKEMQGLALLSIFGAPTQADALKAFREITRIFNPDLHQNNQEIYQQILQAKKVRTSKKFWNSALMKSCADTTKNNKWTKLLNAFGQEFVMSITADSSATVTAQSHSLDSLGLCTSYEELGAVMAALQGGEVSIPPFEP